MHDCGELLGLQAAILDDGVGHPVLLAAAEPNLLVDPLLGLVVAVF
jgi:hypothetical protein